MKEFIMELLGENGKISMMRFMSLTALIIGAIIAFKTPDAVTMVTVFIGAAFAGKVSQKMIESKGEENK